MPKLILDVNIRFWSKTRKRRNGCIEWLASIHPNGYGQFSFNGRPRKSHRISWILTNGEIPNKLFVLHKCDNPICVNPDHLFLGTHKDNMNDMANKGRHVGTKGKTFSEKTKRAMSRSQQIRRHGLKRDKNL